MKITVAIPCYNAERWVAQAIESALAQGGVEPEVIVVDVQQAIEDAKKAVRTEMAASMPELTPLVEESLNAALPAAEAALKAAAGSAARAASIGEIGIICGSSFHAISTHHRNHDLEGRK